jgi:hypothetical protein
MADESDAGDLRRARLLTVYVACCSLRRHFPIPHRGPPVTPVIVDLRGVKNAILRERVRKQLSAWLEFFDSQIRCDPTSPS